MGTYSGSISFRNGNANTTARLVECFNRVTAAFLGCGMLKVDDAEYPGQAGTFVTGTPGPGETQVTALATGTSGNTYVGYNLFKHPTLNLYVRVRYIDYGFSTNAYRAARFAFTVATGLEDGALVRSYGEIYPLSQLPTSNSVSTESFSGNYFNLFASCGEDHFWIGCSGSPVPVSTSTNYAIYPYSIDPLGLAILADQDDPRVLAVLTSAPLGGSNPPSPLSVVTAYRVFLTNSSIWLPSENGSLGVLIDPSEAATAEGIRVAKTQKVVEGIMRYFNAGIVNWGAVTNGSLLEMDILGGAPQKYRAMFTFGPAYPANAYTTTLNNCGLLLPWAGES